MNIIKMCFLPSQRKQNKTHHHSSITLRVWQLTEIFSFIISLNNFYILLIWTQHWYLLSNPIICIGLCSLWKYNDLDLGSRTCWFNKHMPFAIIPFISKPASVHTEYAGESESHSQWQFTFKDLLCQQGQEASYLCGLLCSIYTQMPEHR